MLIFQLLITACSHSVYIFPQSATTDNCNPSTTGVNLRIRNSGSMAFSKFILKTGEGDLEFSGLRKGQTSCYRNIPYVWSANSTTLWLCKERRSCRTIQSFAVDHVGESRIDSGWVTLEISVNGTLEKPVYNYKMIRE